MNLNYKSQSKGLKTGYLVLQFVKHIFFMGKLYGYGEAVALGSLFSPAIIHHFTLHLTLLLLYRELLFINIFMLLSNCTTFNSCFGLFKYRIGREYKINNC